MDTLSLTKEARIYNGVKTISLTNGAGKTGQPLVKEWNNAILSNIDGSRDYNTKWSKANKDKYHIISLICEIKKNSTGGWS